MQGCGDAYSNNAPLCVLAILFKYCFIHLPPPCPSSTPPQLRSTFAYIFGRSVAIPPLGTNLSMAVLFPVAPSLRPRRGFAALAKCFRVGNTSSTARNIYCVEVKYFRISKSKPLVFAMLLTIRQGMPTNLLTRQSMFALTASPTTHPSWSKAA